MELKSILLKPEYQNKSTEEVIKLLSSDVELPHNHEKWSYSGVVVNFGEVAAEGLAQAMTGVGLTTAVITYATVGMDLSLQKTQDNLTAISIAVPQLKDACDALKLIGRPVSKKWVVEGLSELPDKSVIGSVIDEIIEDRIKEETYSEVQRWTSTINNEIILPMLSAGKTIDEIKAAIMELK